MSDELWSDAVESAFEQETLLRLSELQVNMLVKAQVGKYVHRVIEVLVSPDGFASLGIVRTLAENGYDHTWLYEVNGKNDDPAWVLKGWRTEQGGVAV
jgi:hypothetical protein